jgi:hypothetical protein
MHGLESMLDWVGMVGIDSCYCRLITKARRLAEMVVLAGKPGQHASA